MVTGNKPILTIGASAWTTIFKLDAPLPSTSAKLIPTQAIQLGDGMSSSAACAIAALGGNAAWWGRVGNDANGRATLASLEAAGVDVSQARLIDGVQGSFCSVMVDSLGERLVVPRHDPNMPADADWLALDSLNNYAAVLTEVRWPQGAVRALDAARQAKIPAVLDAEIAPAGVLDDLCQRATHVLFSETGLSHYIGGSSHQLMGVRATESALRTAQSKAPNAFVGVTLGEHGFYWLERTHSGSLELCKATALPVEAIDTLGAGDVFHGAFVLAICEGMSNREAAQFACTAASLKCKIFGGRLGAPNRAQVLEAMA
jgi:sulfofructose kinase